MHRILLVAAFLCAAGCATTVPPEAAASAERGRAAALADIAHGTPRFAYIGLDSGNASPADEATGLPRFSIGCCKSREALAYRDAYNETVEEARRGR